MGSTMEMGHGDHGLHLQNYSINKQKIPPARNTAGKQVPAYEHPAREEGPLCCNACSSLSKTGGSEHFNAGIEGKARAKETHVAADG